MIGPTKDGGNSQASLVVGLLAIAPLAVVGPRVDLSAVVTDEKNDCVAVFRVDVLHHATNGGVHIFNQSDQLCAFFGHVRCAGLDAGQRVVRRLNGRVRSIEGQVQEIRFAFRG